MALQLLDRVVYACRTTLGGDAAPRCAPPRHRRCCSRRASSSRPTRAPRRRVWDPYFSLLLPGSADRGPVVAAVLDVAGRIVAAAWPLTWCRDARRCSTRRRQPACLPWRRRAGRRSDRRLARAPRLRAAVFGGSCPMRPAAATTPSRACCSRCSRGGWARRSSSTTRPAPAGWSARARSQAHDPTGRRWGSWACPGCWSPR